MRGLYGSLVVAVAALLVCCSANPYWEQGEQGLKRYGHHGPQSPYGMNLQNVLEYASRPKYQTKYPPSPMENSLYYGGMENDYVKHNFDDIDWANLEAFIAKKNFNDINHSSLPFSYANKRSNLGFRSRFPVYGNSLDFLRSGSDDKTTEKPKSDQGPGNFDEIDHSNLPIGGG